jgi:GxxExxY protein
VAGFEGLAAKTRTREKEKAMAFDSGDAAAEKLTQDVLGAAVEVHKHLGPGHRENHHENALCYEFELRCIPFERQVRVELDYKGRVVGEGVIDLLVGGRLIVELKAVDEVADIHFAQVISYLNIKRLRLGILLNFNVPAMNAKGAIRRVLNKHLLPSA